jgi:hypothetical protein
MVKAKASGFVDEIEDSLVDCCVGPIDDPTIDLSPFCITLIDWRRRAYMGDKTELAKNKFDEASPLTIV